MRASALIILSLGVTLSVGGSAFADDSPWSSSGYAAMNVSTEGTCVCGPGAGWVDGCPAGNDALTSSGAEIGIYLASDPTCASPTPADFVLFGPVTVTRETGTASGIDTEITSMALAGGGATLEVGPGPGNSIKQQSFGTIVQQAAPNDDLADSDFGVFFEATIPSMGTAVWNHSALQISAVIDCVPPDAEYLHPEGQCIALYDDPNTGEGSIVGYLGDAKHDTVVDCGNETVEVGEDCDPPGSSCPGGMVCEEDCTCPAPPPPPPPPPPPCIGGGGDDCAIALTATCNGTVTLDPASDTTPTGPLNGGASPCASGGVNDVWATFVATATNARFRDDLGGSIGTDSEFSIYSVNQADICDSAGWTEIACSGDTAPGTFLGDISVGGLVVGDTYLIQYGHWNDAYTGCFQLDIECPATGGICGDGIISTVGDEECDGAATGNCLLTCDPDCTCTPVPTPMLPKWGLIGLALMLVVGGVGVFGRGRKGAVQA